MIENHSHNGIDTAKLYAIDCLEYAPQPALTTKSVGSLSSGGIYNLSSADSAILTNALTRIYELETKLQTLGLIK